MKLFNPLFLSLIFLNLTITEATAQDLLNPNGLPLCNKNSTSASTPCWASISYGNGEIYAGEIRNNLYNGFGGHTWANGANYVGEFLNGQYNGKGVFTNPDGSRKEGVWHFGHC